MSGLPFFFCPKSQDDVPYGYKYPVTYFSNFTVAKALLYGAAASLVFCICLAVITEAFLTIPCDYVIDGEIEYKNPSYVQDPCMHVRYPQLFFLTKQECAFGRSEVFSVILGGIIGWERRQADRPAGIRTMGLVSLGACLFTINSAFAFLGSPMSWDSSRVSAAIPSGVGFLGSALIFKEAEKDDDGSNRHVVHGLTTAASVWLSAAVGIACGGELYFSAINCTALVLVLLRFGPRMQEYGSDSSMTDTSGGPSSVQFASTARYGTTSRSHRQSHFRDMSAMSASDGLEEDEEDEEDEEASTEEGRKLISRNGTNRRSTTHLTERPRSKPHFSSLV